MSCGDWPTPSTTWSNSRKCCSSRSNASSWSWKPSWLPSAKGCWCSIATGASSWPTRASKRSAGSRNVKGVLYWEVLRESRLNELIKRSLEARQDTRGELDIDDGVYLVHVSPLSGEGPLIVTFSDISEYKRLEKIKRDFVSNLSHELRTPLTAIKGFVETLAEESSTQNRNYLDIINRHTDRLVNMVNDLLTLAEIEEPRMRLQKRHVDLRRLADNVAVIFAGRCREKNIRLEVTADANLPVFFGDPFRLEQLFINLVDNAVKYTERGEIRVSLAGREREIELRVKDSGPGIPAEHLPRIFERFYVVDRSRSREQGGTGLGLAIAKHIVLLHDGRIEAVSEPGQGSEFIVTLPLTT